MRIQPKSATNSKRNATLRSQRPDAGKENILFNLITVGLLWLFF